MTGNKLFVGKLNSPGPQQWWSDTRWVKSLLELDSSGMVSALARSAFSRSAKHVWDISAR